MHTIILGNGIISQTIAFRLAKRASPSDKISIVGKRERFCSATLAAGAMLNSFAELEKDALDNELDLYRFELSHLATRMWPEFEQELIEAAGSCLPSACNNCQGFSGGGCAENGTYVVNNTAADELDDENFDAILKALKDFNEPHHLVAPADIPNYMPEPHHRATRALYIENEGWVNPRLMVEKLDAILNRFPQVEFVDAHVNQLLKGSSGMIETALLDNGKKIAADQFVLATGASVSSILEQSKLGIDVQRIFYGVGVSIEIRSPEFPHTKCIRTPNRGLTCGIYSVPYFTHPHETHDHILLGARNFISPTPYPHAKSGSVESLMKAGMEQINKNFCRADLFRVNVGWRPISQDTYPLLGKISIKNLIIATGTKRDGFHMSPLISQMIVAMLYDEPFDERFQCFSPERKLIHTLSREQAITKAIRYRLLERDELEKLHDQVGAYDWGIPPEMLDMYHQGHAKA